MTTFLIPDNCAHLNLVHRKYAGSLQRRLNHLKARIANSKDVVLSYDIQESHALEYALDIISREEE